MTAVGYHEALVRRGSALHLEHVPTEVPSAGGVVIAPSFVGVCGTDLQILNGSRPDTAEILGHEGVGVVVKSARIGAPGVGEQVVFNPAAQLSSGYILGHNTPGLFQTYIAVDSRALEEGLVMATGGCHPPICAALIEPLGAVVYAYELLCKAVSSLRTVVVFGGGPVGLLATIFLGSLGVRPLLVHPSQARMDTAGRLNILSPEGMLAASDDVAERLIERNKGHPVDAALICTTRSGGPSALRQAVEVVRHGGCIDLITNYPENAAVPYGIDAGAVRAVRSTNICGSPREGKYVSGDISGRRIALTSHRGTSHAHLQTALRALGSDPGSYMRLITHVLPLREAAGAIQTLSESKSHFVHGMDCIKLVINMAGSRHV